MSDSKTAAPTPEQADAAIRAQLDSFVREDQPPQDVDPDAMVQDSPKPKKLPATASNVEEDNESASPALVVAEDDEDDAAENPDGDEEDEPKPKKKSVSERIKELTRKRSEAQAESQRILSENAQLKARLDALERGEKPKDAAKPNGAAVADGKPDPTKFKLGEFDPDYTEAREKWMLDEAERRAEAKLEKRQQEQTQAARLTELETKRDKMAEAGVAEFGDDYLDLVIGGATENKWPISPTMAELTLESDVGYKIAHHLATHPKEAREVFGKSTIAQAAYFGRLEAQFLSDTKSATARPSPKQPVIPNPPKHQARGTAGKFAVTADTSDFAAFEAMAKQQR